MDAYWTYNSDDALAALATSASGLSSAEAARRLRENGPNQVHEQRDLTRAAVLLNQLRNPLIWLLLFAAGASTFAGEWVDALIVSIIVLVSAGIGYSREYRAQAAAAELRKRIRVLAHVLRDGGEHELPLSDLVPGDVVRLSAGSLVPADCLLLSATDCFVNEAVLTGESFPAEKRCGKVDTDAPLARRRNCLFLGTNVRSGAATALVVATGQNTHYGAIAERLTLRPPETDFDRGIRHFGYLLLTAMTVMVLLVFAANVALGRPAVETFLFSVALAVGLSPELLPAILNVNLARGARLMAEHGVLVRHLSAIENLGGMDILCTDKTGTLTQGVVRLGASYDEHGAQSPEVLVLATYNAALQRGLENPLDRAILDAGALTDPSVVKAGEIPYDFVRKRLSVVVRRKEGLELISKGAFEHVLEVCTTTASGRVLDDAARAELRQRFLQWSNEGQRVLAVARKSLPEGSEITRAAEHDLQLVGFLAFLDQPKEGVNEALANLWRLGIEVKLITGDAKAVARHVADAVGMSSTHILTGAELDELHDEALWHAAEKTHLFVEVDPNQKERIILALKKMGHVVGFMGDGVNDAPAMHAADTSISVREAVDVAKEAADFVLLERHLDVVRRGVEEGRRTFANSLKYLLATTSANFGNMLSMAVASLLIPFLPLTAGQILLNNLLSDVPAIGLADDNVDAEWVERPGRWDMRLIAHFMVEFGLLSSLFDFMTFGVLLRVFHAQPALFRTGWFLESLLTELAVALVVRTRRPCFRSRPGALLVRLTAAVAAVAPVIPYLPASSALGFVPLPAKLFLAVLGITLSYVVVAELVKARLYGATATQLIGGRP